MLGRFIQPDSIVPEPGNPQSLNRYSYVLNNPLRYTDPTGYFTDDEVKTAYGVDDLEDIWWWDDPAYDGWQQILISSTTWGDVMVAEVDGVTYRAMFVATSSGHIVLWDIDNGQAIHPDLFATPDRWQVFRSETQDYQNFRRSYGGADLSGHNGHHFVEPTLPSHWEKDRLDVATHSWLPRIKAGYAYPEWTWADTRNVAIATASGALAGSLGGPEGAAIGAVATGGAAAIWIVDQKIDNATMMPIVSNHSDVMTGRPSVWSTRHHRISPR
jgi:hypothetical protein